MEVIKIIKNTESRIEMAVIAIKMYCVIHKITVSKSEIDILAYFMVYGFKQTTKQLILRSGIFKNPASIENNLSSLRNKGLIVKVDIGLQTESGRNEVCEGLRVEIKDSLGFIIKLQNI